MAGARRPDGRHVQLHRADPGERDTGAPADGDDEASSRAQPRLDRAGVDEAGGEDRAVGAGGRGRRRRGARSSAAVATAAAAARPYGRPSRAAWSSRGARTRAPPVPCPPAASRVSPRSGRTRTSRPYPPVPRSCRSGRSDPSTGLLVRAGDVVLGAVVGRVLLRFTTSPPCRKIRPTSTVNPGTGLWLRQSGSSSVYFFGCTKLQRALFVRVMSHFLVP